MTGARPGGLPEELSTIDGLQAAFRRRDYVADRSLATAVFLALRLDRPLLLEGEAGVGKTQLAKTLADTLGTRLIRLQCYEGLDVTTAVYEWNYPRQMLEIRLLEARGEIGTFLSPPLREALAVTLGAGEQAMLFLNRRGYAPLTLCEACGHKMTCPNC